LLSLCTVIERGSFSKAAQALGITQPAVSQQIRRLEDLYETQLIHRQGGAVVPTPAGTIAYEYATQIIALFEKSQVAAREKGQEVSGQLTVAASTGVGEDFLPQVLASFRDHFPDVRVNMQVGDSAEILARLLRERLDLGFVGSTQSDRHLQFEHFMQDQLILVVSPKHPIAERQHISREEFLELPLILQQAGSGATGALHRSLEEHGIQLNDLTVIGEAGLQESTKSMVRAGTVGTIISLLGALRDLADGRLSEIAIDGLDLKHDFYIAYSKDWPLSQAARSFMDLARAAAKKVLRTSL
jgi:DNA-binding transcriptional LysR family regulator